VVPDTTETTEVVTILEDIALNQIPQVYKACDTIEGLEENLSYLLYDDHHFKVMKSLSGFTRGSE
jgi:hypothetical protein